MNTQTNITQKTIQPIVHSGRKLRAKAMKRVSTDKQDVQRQEREIQRIARRIGAEIVGTVELQGVSGKDTLSHAQVQKLLGELESPDIDGLIIPAVDRLFRPQRLEDYQIGITFQNFRKFLWTETDGTIEMWTPEGRDAFIEAGKRAGAELRKIRQRSMSGKVNALTDPERLSKVPGGHTPLNSPSVPYGYEFVPRDRMRDIPAYMIIDEIEAATVRRCFDWAMLKLTCGAIASILNAEGVKTKRAGRINRKGHDGSDGMPVVEEKVNDGLWTEQTVYQMLTKSHYIGKYLAYPGTENETACTCPAIVAVDVFETVQLILEANKKEATGPTGEKREWLLTGMGWCKFCGHRLMTQTRRKIEDGYYICSFRSKPPVHCICTGPLPFLDKHILEPAVFDTTWAAVTTGDTLVRMIAEAYADAPGDPLAAAEAEVIRERLVGLRLTLERAHRNMTNPHYDEALAGPEFAAAKKAVVNEEFRLTQAMAAAAPRKTARPDDAAIVALAARLAATKPEGFAERRQWLHGIVASFVTDGKVVEIECLLSQDAFAEAAAGAEGVVADAVLIPSRRKYSTSELTPPLSAPISFRLTTTL